MKTGRRDVLTADPLGDFRPRQEPDYILRERIAVPLDQVVLLRTVDLRQARDVLVESIFVDVRLAAVDDLHGLAVVRRARPSFEDALSVEHFAPEGDHRCMPDTSISNHI